ncbi:hypothetical protein [Actinoallomurus sp. CA-150999]|uniref:hypothetical protein n=1 Tax=Actinoallomurus sp. CA-150999 TaxID=3239887 RepID=UPI003D93F1FD
MTRRSAVWIAVVPVLALSVTGCGGGGGKGAAHAATRGAKATPAGSPLPADQVVSVVSQKIGETRTLQAAITLNLSRSGRNAQLIGQLTYQRRPRAAVEVSATTMSVDGKAMEVFDEILIGDDLYISTRQYSDLRGGKPWMKAVLPKLGTHRGADYDALLNQALRADPSADMRMLTASKDARAVGAETVGDVSTTRYHGTYSVAGALAELGGAQRARMRRLLGKVPDNMEFDLWVDGQRLPRKLTVTSPASAAVKTVRSMSYSGFNAPVSLSPPPASKILGD